MKTDNDTEHDADGIPLDIFQTKTYQRFLLTGEPEVTEEIRLRHDVLVDKRLHSEFFPEKNGELSPEEADELKLLELEMDASDYAAQPPDRSWSKRMQAEREESERKLDEIEKRIMRMSPSYRAKKGL